MARLFKKYNWNNKIRNHLTKKSIKAVQGERIVKEKVLEIFLYEKKAEQILEFSYFSRKLVKFATLS